MRHDRYSPIAFSQLEMKLNHVWNESSGVNCISSRLRREFLRNGIFVSSVAASKIIFRGTHRRDRVIDHRTAPCRRCCDENDVPLRTSLGVVLPRRNRIM